MSATPPGPSLDDVIEVALAEDLGPGDATAELTVPADAKARGRIVQKQSGVVYGMEIAAAVFARFDCELDKLMLEAQWRDGVPAEVALVYGPARGLLAAERVALNLLGRLSGIATLTARYVKASRADGGKAAVLDTRKTTPGLRALEKQAVKAGGGRNHRMGLYDEILIKENHIAIAGGLARAVELARSDPEGRKLVVECSDQAEVRAALAAGADRLLLDNMDLAGLRESVALRDELAPGTPLEASGGVSLETVGAISATGVEFISVGALTHSATTLDLSLLIQPV